MKHKHCVIRAEVNKPIINKGKARKFLRSLIKKIEMKNDILSKLTVVILTYKTDKNPFGRDPLGQKINRRAAKPEKSYTKNKLSPLAYEQAEALNNSLGKMKRKTKKVILESLKDDSQHDDKGGLLDEKNLIDDTI